MTTKPFGSLLLAVMVLLWCCVNSESQEHGTWFHDAFADVNSVKVDGFSGERSGDVCSTFDLTQEDVAFFFKHARFISGYSLEKEYPWYPCSVEGVVDLDSSRFRWSITPSGKGALEAEGSDTIYLVCDEGCEAVFPAGGNMFAEELESEKTAKRETSSTGGPASDSWFEIWVDVATSPPYPVILRSTRNGLEVIDPKAQDAVVFQCSNYSEARDWLMKGYRLAEGRMSLRPGK
jgi:hypothetical protein